MLQLKDKKIKLFFYIFLLIFLSTVNLNYNKVQNPSILAIKKIYVSGLSDLDNLKVEKNLSPLLLKNILFVNKKKLNEILSKNNLIESSDIKKIYPDLLKVNIKKTDFLATINKENSKFIIASNGKSISFDEISMLPEKLPFVFGKVSNNNFINLKKIIDNSKFEYKDIEAFYFFPSNRIDIKIKNGFLIKLPYNNLAEALRLANLIKKDSKFKNNKILDLRITNHIITSNE
jgi:cell division protein FtsQ|tara:strand:- start:1880 stop:2575 length:696 start_codon:yes stop_codon:yes gene_type:complete